MEIPRELNFAQASDLPLIPSGSTSTENYIPQVGGASSFSLLTSGNNCIFDLPSRGYIDPSTIYLKYKIKTTQPGAAAAQIRSTAGYSPISRVDTFVGSSLIESMINYNVYQNFKIQTTMNNSMKYTQAASLGIRSERDIVTSNSLDGRFCDAVASTEFGVCVPLDNCLSNVKDVLVPICFLSSVRVSITFDTISNIFAIAPAILEVAGVSPAYAATVLPTECIISDVFLCYTSIHFPPEIDEKFRKQYANDNIVLKTQSYLLGSNMIAANTVGQIDLQVNHRLTSVRSCFLLMSTPTSANGIFDSFDITQGSGEYSIVISGKTFPSRPHNTNLAHKNGMLLELRKAVNSLYSKDSNMSINTLEFNRLLLANPVPGQAGASTVLDPAKFYPAFRTHLLGPNSSFLSGIACNDGPIGIRITAQLPVAIGCTVSLVSVYDMLIKIDVTTKTATSSV